MLLIFILYKKGVTSSVTKTLLEKGACYLYLFVIIKFEELEILFSLNKMVFYVDELLIKSK